MRLKVFELVKALTKCCQSLFDLWQKMGGGGGGGGGGGWGRGGIGCEGVERGGGILKGENGGILKGENLLVF